MQAELDRHIESLHEDRAALVVRLAKAEAELAETLSRLGPLLSNASTRDKTLRERESTRCKRGHSLLDEMTPENTIQEPSRPGRICRTCRRASKKRGYRRAADDLRSRYQRRRAEGRCTRSGCQEPATGYLCDRHAAERQAQRS